MNSKIIHIVQVENIISPPQIFVEILLKIKKNRISRKTCTTCKRNKSLIVSDQTINGEGL